MRAERRQLIEESAGLKHSIQRMEAKTEALENDKAAQERAYRRTFNYREPGEKIVYFDED